LADAFQNDPALQWIMPATASRLRGLPPFFDWLFDDHQRHGMITCSAHGEVSAFWRNPGKVHHHEQLSLADIWHLIRIFGVSLPRADKIAKAVAAHVPQGEDYLYLRYVGVRSDCQGKGLGGSAIRSGIAHANGLGVGVCLETAKQENVGIYQRLGFMIANEWQATKSGPHFWTMVRPKD
jgi:ribosomal protein S18 acetylase RimI-like enzyme